MISRIDIYKEIADEQRFQADWMARKIQAAPYYQALADQFAPILEKEIGEWIAKYGLPFLMPKRPLWADPSLEEPPAIPTIEFSYTQPYLSLSLIGPRSILGKVFRFLHSKGYALPISTRRPKNETTYWSHTFCHPAGYEVYVSFSSTSCRRVKVGTKMVEEAVYETICG